MTRLRATCAFLAGVLLNVTATVCMVAYSEACRRREVERESIMEEVGGMSEVERRANERYLSIIAALREIADDETADPKRRKIARDALAADARRGPQTSLFMESGNPPRHRTSGGLAEHTRAIEEGWDA